MKELTFEEFSEKPLKYTLGMSFDDGASRMYRNDEIGLQVEVHTKRNPRTLEWGRGSVYWLLDNDKREFRSCDQAYVAYMEKVCGVA